MKPWEKYQSATTETKPWEKYAQAPAAEAQPESDTVPQWGRENPNAYGVAGAVKETALTAGRAAKNLPGDVLRLGGEAAKMLTTQTPVDVGLSIGKIATGGVGKLIPGEQPYEQDFDALANIYKAKYGSLENLKKTIEEKPAEFLADITGAMGGAGAALKGAGKVSGVKALETAGKDVTEAGVKIGMSPVTATVRGVKGVQTVGRKVTDKILPSPEGLYESAAKWSTTLKPEVRAKITNTMLKEDIGLNPQGYEKLASTVDDLNEQIKAQIKPFARKPIDATQVNRWTREARTKAAKTLERDKNLAQIDEVVNDFNKTWGEGKLTVGKAQAIKQDIYKELKSHYDAKSKGGSKYTDAEVAAKKNIARGLKESIEKATGGKVRDLNARESALLNAEPHLRRAVGRTGNHNILSLDDVLAATAGGVVGGPLGAAAFGVARKALGSPSMKARLAIEIYKRQQKGIKSAEFGALPGKERAILSSKITDIDKERFLVQENLKQGGFKALPADTKGIYGPDGQFVIVEKPRVMRKPAPDTKFYKKVEGAVLIYDPAKDNYFTLPDNINQINKARQVDILELAKEAVSKPTEPTSKMSELLESAAKSQRRKTWPDK